MMTSTVVTAYLCVHIAHPSHAGPRYVVTP